MGAILIDLDGVVYDSNGLIPGADAAMHWIQKQNIPYLFLTNTTSQPRTEIVKKLHSMHVDIIQENILSPPVVAKHWLQRQLLRKVALFAPMATQLEFDNVVLVPRTGGDTVDAVIIGDLGQDWNYETLNQAFQLLMREPHPQLVALGMTRYWQKKEGLCLDVGPYVTALQYATGIEPIVLGKPSALFYRSALQILSIEAQQAIMIGDDIQGDIKGSQELGMQGILVKTGKFRESDLNRGIKPTVVLDSIADLPQWVQTNCCWMFQQ